MTQSAPPFEHGPWSLAGVAVHFWGPLSSVPLREATAVVRRQGGSVVESVSEAELIVVGDDARDRPAAADQITLLGDRPEVIPESAFIERLLGDEPLVRAVHSPSALAEIVGAPVAAIRRWRRRGYLRPSREIGRLPLFDWSEARVAQRLAELLASGCSLPRVDAVVAELEAQSPDVDRPLLSLPVEVRDGRLLIRAADRLTEPGGQTVLDFDAAAASVDDDDSIAAIPFPASELDPLQAPEVLRSEAWRLAETGDHAGAAEACRVLLLTEPGRADDHFLLAYALEGQGDLTAARERYFTAIECDDSFVEARLSLGCLLDELGDHETAVAVLEGAADIAPELAETHYHLARVLDTLHRGEAAESHWRRCLEIAPAGPHAAAARERLALHGG